MKRNLYSMVFAMLVLSAVPAMAQTYEVPVSMHKTDQVVQGPCYIFAALAALESKAVQHTPNAVNEYEVNFYEWLFYSNGVLKGDQTYSGDAMIRETLKHMNTIGAKNRPGHENFDRANLPNLHLRETVANELTGLASFRDNPNSSLNCNSSWWQTFGDYLKQSDGACEDKSGDHADFPVSATFTTTNGSASPVEHYKLNLPPGGNPASPFVRISTTGMNVFQKHAAIANVLSSTGQNTGVIALFDNYHNEGIEHAIFIYKKNGTNYWYKDSWPTGSLGHGPKFIKPSDPGEPIQISRLVDIYYIDGTVANQAPVIPPTSDPCKYVIDGPSQVWGETTFTLENGVGDLDNIVWSVGSNLEIVDGQGEIGVTVRSTNCAPFSFGSDVSVTYDNDGQSCSKSENVTALGRFIGTPVIRINGPIQGLHQVCAGSAIQLEAIDLTNLPYPETTYEWDLTGATILNGHGTRVVNILVSSVDGAFQNYRVRAYDSVCGGYSPWAQTSGYLASSCGPGGGVGIFQNVTRNPEEVNFTNFFTEVPQATKVMMKVVSLNGVVLMDKEVNANNPVQSLRNLQRGVAVIRLYSPDTGETKSMLHLIGNN